LRFWDLDPCLGIYVIYIHSVVLLCNYFHR
jgi:hypothetical protein